MDYDKNTERLRTAAQGLTLGFGDEIEAGVRSVGSDESYKTIRDRIRSRELCIRVKMLLFRLLILHL